MFSGRTMRVNPIITRHIGTKALSALLVTCRGHGARLGSTNKSTHEIIAQRSAVHYIIGASFMLFAVQTAGLRKHCAIFFSFSESPVRFDLVPCVPRRIIKSFFCDSRATLKRHSMYPEDKHFNHAVIQKNPRVSRCIKADSRQLSLDLFYFIFTNCNSPSWVSYTFTFMTMNEF